MARLQLDEVELHRAQLLRHRLQVIAPGSSVLSESQQKRWRRAARLHALIAPESSTDTSDANTSFDTIAGAIDDASDVMRKRVNDANARREAAAERAARVNPDLDIRADMDAAATNASLSRTSGLGRPEVSKEALETWRPDVALMGSSTRVPFIADQVMHPAEDDDELADFLQQQRRICKGCLNPIKKKGFSFRGAKYDARFCYYTGYYYCRDCHSNAFRCRIPARCLVDWDFDEYPVCDRAGEYLELINDQPLFCISAQRPQLYMQCPLLAVCRQLRVQLGMMNEVGKECKRFLSAFYTPPAATMQTSLHESVESPAPAYVPADKKYLVDDSECWSLSDLGVFQHTVAHLPENDARSDTAAWGNASPSRSRRGVRLTDEEQRCPMLQYLRRLRSQMVRHIAHGCPDQCHAEAARACGACTVDEVIYAFDIDNCVTCPRCTTVFHRHCWETKVNNGCPNCAARSAKEAASRRRD